MMTYEEGQVNQQALEFGLINEAHVAINHYVLKANSGDYYESKNTRLTAWQPAQGDIHELIIAIFTQALLNNKLNLQSIIGLVAGKISLNDPLDRAKTAAECIALCAQVDLIDIEASGVVHGMYSVTTKWQLDEEIKRSDKHEPITRKPLPKTENQILGCRYKQHNEETCLDHINRMNAIELQLDKKFLSTISEESKRELDTQQKIDQFNLFRSRSYRAYIKLARGGNRFYLEHANDVRGRTYCDGYYITYQGNSFRKAIVQLAKEEIVTM